MQWKVIAAVVLLGAATQAQDKAAIDVWNGRWDVRLSFEGEKAESTWIEILPDAWRGYVVRTKSGAKVAILVQTPERLELQVHDTVRTWLEVTRKGDDVFTGRVRQPAHATRTEGTVTGSRTRAYSGFYISGPARLSWGEKATYVLQYAKNGKRVKWHAPAVWKKKSEGDAKATLEGHKRSSSRTLIAPPAPAGNDFAEMRVRLRANAHGKAPLADDLDWAELTVVVTNVPKKCAALEARIRGLETALRNNRTRLGQIDAHLAALRFPEPWKDTAGLDAAVAEEKKAIAALEADADKTGKAIETMRRTERSIGAFRRRLRALTTEAGRAFSAIEWYKTTAGTRRDQADFIRLFKNQRPGPRVDAEFHAAYKEARDRAIATVGVGIVQLGGLLTLIPSGGVTSMRSLMQQFLQLGTSFTLSTYVDVKVNSAAVLRDLKISEETVAGLSANTDELGRLARAHAAASGSARRKIEVALNRTALRAMTNALKAERGLRAARLQAQRARGSVWSALRGRRSTLAQLERQKKKEGLAADRRRAEIEDATRRKRTLTASRTTVAAALARDGRRLAELRALHEKHCVPYEEPAPPPDLHHCVRGRILASTYFMGSTAGWAIDGDAKDLKAVGNHIRATDLGKGHYWFFRAPAGYTGDKRAAYGATLEFELNQIENGSAHFSGTLVALSDGTTTLTYHVAKTPARGWTRFEVCLHESHKWRHGKKAVTKETFLAVLKNLTVLHINCEHSSGRDIGGLRNVVLYGAR